MFVPIKNFISVAQQNPKVLKHENTMNQINLIKPDGKESYTHLENSDKVKDYAQFKILKADKEKSDKVWVEGKYSERIEAGQKKSETVEKEAKPTIISSE